MKYSPSFLYLFTCLALAASFPIYCLQYYLVACAIFQDEAFFLKEWIEYHKLIGVEHFYLYNNQSTDNYREILQPYVKEGLVDLIEWDVKTNNQTEYLELLQKPAYKQALNLIKGKTTWAAFIDLDEFLVPMHHQNLQTLLKNYEEFGGLAINWQLFGTSGLQNLPENGLLIEHLTWKAHPLRPLNQFIKFIVQPQTVVSVHDPHDFDFQEGAFAVNSNKNPLANHARGQPVILDTICINHYWFGTLDWFLHHKIPRREKWGIHFSKEHLNDIIAAYNEIEDKNIQRFVPLLKQAIQGEDP
jgi:Glycosyltransferase family 92